MNNSEIVLFETADNSVVLPVHMTGDTVWLNRSQMAELFERDVKTIGKHINNALREEVDSSVVAKFATTASDGKTYQVEYYNLDMSQYPGSGDWRTAPRRLQPHVLDGMVISPRRLLSIRLLISSRPSPLLKR